MPFNVVMLGRKHRVKEIMPFNVVMLGRKQ